MLSRLFGKPKKNNSAVEAKERLQVIIATRRGSSGDLPFNVEELKEKLINVIKEYIDIDEEDLKFDTKNGEMEISVDFSSCQGKEKNQ